MLFSKISLICSNVTIEFIWKPKAQNLPKTKNMTQGSSLPKTKNMT